MAGVEPTDVLTFALKQLDEIRRERKPNGADGDPRPAPPMEATDSPLLREPRMLNFAALAQLTPPPRQWFIANWLGKGATLLAGIGGGGKSILAQHLTTCASIGRRYITDAGPPLRCLLLNAEDDHDELWLRQALICAHEGIDMAELHSHLHIESRYGCENALMAEVMRSLSTTPALKRLREQVNDLRIDVLVLDNAAHFLLADHDNRTVVTAFINALNSLVVARPFAVVIVGHISRAHGSEFTGSVAWENAVRMRWYLGPTLPDQKADDSDDGVPSNVMYLCKRKANYTAKDWMRFTMRDSLLVPDDPTDSTGAIVAAIDQRAVDRVCLKGFEALRNMGVAATDSRNTADYLPSQLLDKKLHEGHTRAELAAAMNRLMTAGTFKRDVIGQYSNRTPKHGLVLVVQL